MVTQEAPLDALLAELAAHLHRGQLQFTIHIAIRFVAIDAHTALRTRAQPIAQHLVQHAYLIAAGADLMSVLALQERGERQSLAIDAAIGLQVGCIDTLKAGHIGQFVLGIKVIG